MASPAPLRPSSSASAQRWVSRRRGRSHSGAHGQAGLGVSGMLPLVSASLLSCSFKMQFMPVQRPSVAVHFQQRRPGVLGWAWQARPLHAVSCLACLHLAHTCAVHGSLLPAAARHRQDARHDRAQGHRGPHHWAAGRDDQAAAAGHRCVRPAGRVDLQSPAGVQAPEPPARTAAEASSLPASPLQA